MYAGFAGLYYSPDLGHFRRSELSAGYSATRWSKGSFSFREDREVIINLVTQLSMRVEVPPSRCRSDSITPRPATGSQGSEAGLNESREMLGVSAKLR